ncbi:4Fe-4S dicluster domain-containing protein [Candidatus Micrarchaeota archaeon]|nr:4Fe-4S dicluster domain-containing protein [Candidatus Micrarchaeota archaeon]
MPIKINHSRCIQCIGCASVCPTGAIELDGLRMVFHPEKCISCGACARACPANAIKFIPKEGAKQEQKKEE